MVVASLQGALPPFFFVRVSGPGGLLTVTRHAAQAYPPSLCVTKCYMACHGPWGLLFYGSQPKAIMPHTTKQTKIATIEQGLQALASALQLGSRDDGSSYRYIRIDHPMYEDLIGICIRLHSGELPNDWRFEAIYDICHSLLEYSEPSEDTFLIDDFSGLDIEISNALVDTSYSSLFEWLSKNNGRQEWMDDCIVYSCFRKNDTIGDIAQLRQAEELAWMVRELIVSISEMIG